MSVVLSIEDVGPCRKRLKVEVPAPAVEAESKRVVEEYRKHAKLPGFRKGKVPTELVKQKFHKEIEQDVVERLLPRYWKQAEAESELDPLLPPSGWKKEETRFLKEYREDQDKAQRRLGHPGRRR